MSEEQFLADWDERWKQLRGTAVANMRAQAEERRKRIGAGAAGQDGGPGPDGAEG